MLPTYLPTYCGEDHEAKVKDEGNHYNLKI